MSQLVLQAQGLVKRFGGITATDHVNLSLQLGARHALIGPNGAGKTTLFNIIAGMSAPDRGSIAFAGERIDGLTPDEICRRGIGRTFQLVRPFPALSVEDNVVIGAMLHRHDPAVARRRARDVLGQLDQLAAEIEQVLVRHDGYGLPRRGNVARVECVRADVDEQAQLVAARQGRGQEPGHEVPADVGADRRTSLLERLVLRSPHLALLELAEIRFLGPFGAIHAAAEAFGGVAGALLGFTFEGH